MAKPRPTGSQKSLSEEVANGEIARSAKPAATPPVKPARKPVAPATPAAKGRTTKPATVPAEPVAGDKTDSLITAMRSMLRTQYGHSAVPTATEAKRIQSVVPCPFPFEFLFGVNGMGVGQVIGLDAPAGSGKTALLADMGGWVIRGSDGVFSVVENESRLDVDWISSILGPVAMQSFQPLLSQSLEDVQGLSVAVVQKYQALCSLLPGGKRERRVIESPPMLLGVDSLTGKASLETMDKIIGTHVSKGVGKGVVRTGGGESISRAFPVEAGQLAKFFRSFATSMSGWPIVYVATNQLRLKDKPGQWAPEKIKAGGVQIDFAKNYAIELYRGASLKSRDAEGVQVTLKLGKSIGGSDKRQVLTRLIWWYEQDPTNDDAIVKRAQWDWGWATIRLLLDISTGDKFPYFKNRWKDADLHIGVPKGSDEEGAKLAWSKMLGMKESEAMPFGDLAEAMVSDRKVLSALRKALGIVERPAVTNDYAAKFVRRLKAQVK